MSGGFNVLSVEVLVNGTNEAGVDNIDNETREDSVDRVPYRDDITVLDEEGPHRDETIVANKGDTYRDETTILHDGEAYRNERTASDETALNPKSESAENETKKKFSILDIGECFSDSSETEGISQYTPILFPRKETTNDVTSSESSSDSDELEDVYGHIVFRRNVRHKTNEKVDLLDIHPKSLPYRISNRVKKQSKFITEDNIDQDILHQNLERLRGILLKIRAAKLKKKSDIEKEIIKKYMAILKPCTIVLERLDMSTVVVTSHNRDSREISRTERKKPKNRIAKPKTVAKKLRKNVIAAPQPRPCTRSSKIHKTRRKVYTY